jgi:DNA repair protein RadC
MAVGAEGATWIVHSPRDVADRLILQLGGLEREELVVLLLNTKNMVVGQQTVYRGNVSASLVRVGELFTEAVRRGVARILIAHNHPSSDPTPSPDDLNLTAMAIAAGGLLDIEVLDHIVVGQTSFVSLRDRGLAFDASVPARHASLTETGR